MYHFTMTTVKVAVLLALLTVINSAIAQDATARVNVVQVESGEEGRSNPQQSCDTRLLGLQNRLDECNEEAEKARRKCTDQLNTCNSRLQHSGTELEITKQKNQELTEEVTKLRLIEKELKEKLLNQTINQDMLVQILNVTTLQSIHLKDIEILSNSSIQKIKNHHTESNRKSDELLEEILSTKSKVNSGFATSAWERNVQYNRLNNNQQQLLQLVEATREKADLAAGGRVRLSNNIYYFSNTNAMTWYDAKNFCTSQGLHLASIQTAEENKQMAHYQWLFGFIWAWIGATDETQENTWRWINNGEKMNYSNWLAAGQPDGGRGQNCMLMRIDGVLQDYICETTYPFFCKL